MGERLEPAQWYASLASFLASATALITNREGTGILAVKPNYRPHWNLPGGIMEADEPPHLCCAREVAEELGMDLSPGRLLVMDWIEPTAIRKAWFGYVFDGGVLDDPAQLTLQNDELDAVTFIDQTRVRDMFTANTADRVEAALAARVTGGRGIPAQRSARAGGQLRTVAAGPELGDGKEVARFRLPRLDRGMAAHRRRQPWSARVSFALA